MDEIKLLKNNQKRTDTDVEWVEEFYQFLQGVVPKGIHYRRGCVPKLSKKKAFAIIYYLQEHFPLIPDHMEVCWWCGDIFDSGEGLYWETKGRYYCGGCDYNVPQNYDRGRK